MAKAVLFGKLKTKYPQFKNLSSNFFTKLDRRTEMYPIIKQLRKDYATKVDCFYKYTNQSTQTLGENLFTFVKNNL